MNRKTVVFISLGILAAAVLCTVAGLIVYFTAHTNPVLFLVGIFMIAMGVIMASVPIIILIVILIITLIEKSKNNKNGADL